MRSADLVGRTVVVWGAGREGRSAVAHLAAVGVPSTLVVTDGDAAPDVLTGVAAVNALEAADVVVRSPGIPALHPLVARLAELDVTTTTGTALWLAENAARTIGVTGSKGKSTVSSLVLHVLRHVEVDVAAGGNIGVPMLELPPAKQAYVVEVSSFQADSVDTSPRVGVFTSLFPEHLDWHGTVEAYAAAKLNLFSHGCEVLVANATDPAVREAVAGCPDLPPVTWVGEGVEVGADLRFGDAAALRADDVPLVGRHNLVNIVLAVAAAHAAFPEIPVQRLADGVRTFRPLAHRLEPVDSTDGRRWVDDGLATNPQATIASLEVFAADRVALLLGGSDRGVDYEPLWRYLAERTAPVQVFTLPPSGAAMAAGIGAPHEVVHCGSFVDAVAAITHDVAAGGVVLLAPGAPSFGEFTDYAERSAAFAAAAAAARPA